MEKCPTSKTHLPLNTFFFVSHLNPAKFILGPVHVTETYFLFDLRKVWELEICNYH